MGQEGKEVWRISQGQLYFGPLVQSSFMAEARALDAGLCATRRAISGVGKQWKKEPIECAWETRRPVVRL